MSTTKEVSALLLRFICDIVAVFLAFLPFILLSLQLAQPFQRGFYCDDESIRYPYRPDTVTLQALFMGILLIPTGIVLITELVRYFLEKGSSEHQAVRYYSLTSRCSVPGVVALLYSFLGYMYFSFAVIMGLVDIGKFSSGRLRPHFISVCQPDPTTYNCTAPGNPDEYVYVEKFTCRGRSALAIWNARLAFPSGHAALSACFAILVVIYLEARLTWKPIKMMGRVLELACVAAAIYICISRVCDNAHSWSDVIAGAILGLFVGGVTGLRIWRISRLSNASRAVLPESTDAEVKTEPGTRQVVANKPTDNNADRGIVPPGKWNAGNDLCNGVGTCATAFVPNQYEHWQPSGMVSRVVYHS